MAADDKSLISRAAAVLRDSCDQLLNDNGTLELTCTAMRTLHANFAAISVCKPADGGGAGGLEFEAVAGSALLQTQSLLDLQFLYDVAQLTQRLRVTTGGDAAPTVCGPATTAASLVDSGTCSADWLAPGEVSLAAFRRLERLELESVPVVLVRGLQARRPYLRAVSCTAGVTSLAELLAACGGDASSPFLWDELTEVRVTRCRLEFLDASVKLMPHVEVVDLSHNRLASAERLDYLSSLRRLNLAVNQLVKVPRLSVPASMTLRWLSLRSNKLESLTGLEDMVGLEYVDVSYNCLLSHYVLSPLAELSQLKALHLSGNPLCCYSDHRRRTAEYLHRACRTEQFSLDGSRLRRSELPRRVEPPSTLSDPRRPPSPGLGRPRRLPSGSTGSTPRARRRRATKKRSRVNVADISDMDSVCAAPLASSASLRDVAAPMSSSADSKEPPPHLVTREQIEGLRQQLGADWLHSRGGTIVQELLGLPQQQPPNFIVGSLPKSDSCSPLNGSRASRTPTGADQVPAPAPTPADAAPTASPEPSLYSRRQATDLSWELESSEEEDDDDEVVCLVVARRLPRRGPEEDVMVTVTDTALKEKELDAGRTVAEWDLRSVEACHITKMEPLTVQLNFDTVKKEKRERNYLMEQSEWEELSAVLLPLIEMRLASELAANALQCIKCSAEFSDGLARTIATQEGDGHDGQFRQVQSCPNCGSSMLIRAEKVSHPNAEVARSPGSLARSLSKKSPLKKRLSSKKIVASTPRHMLQSRAENSEESSPAVDVAATEPAVSETSSTTTRVEVHTSSSVSVVTPEPNETGAKVTPEPSVEPRTKGDSDVEVISNPSESSIEVILDTTARSRNAAEQPAVGQETTPGDAAPDHPRPMDTSSSSGSMSASICTVWEHQQRSPLQPQASQPQPQPQSQAEPQPDATELNSTLTPESGCNSGATTPSVAAVSPWTVDSGALSPFAARSGDTCVQSVDGGAAVRETALDEEPGACVLRSWLQEVAADGVEEVGRGALRFWHDDLVRADHRLQLHLEINVFESEEQLQFVAKCTCGLDPRYVELDCVLVVSTVNLYIFETSGTDSDELERWLRLRLSRPLTEVTCLSPLLNCHGIGVQLLGHDPALNTQLLLLTRDTGRGQQLLACLREACVGATESGQWQRTQQTQVEHMLSGDSGADLSLTELVFVQLLSADHEAVPVMLCMTPTDLMLMECDLRWVVPGHGDVKIPMRDREKVANIVGLELLRCAAGGRPAVRLLFQDPVSAGEHSWLLSALSGATLSAVVTALRQPWAQATGAASPQTPCDVYRTADGDVLHLGPLSPDLTGWVKVTAVRRLVD